tara:strand:- start:1436 stop:1858 length:423 start_codon:yes stop_codon:yes gene_type:complete
MSAYGSGAISPRRKEIIYRDLGLSFTAHPITKKVTVLENEEAIKRAIRNLVLTNKGERFYNPLFGGNVTAYLFENFDFTVEFDIKKSIARSIETYEPRVSLNEVRVKSNTDGNSMEVTIIFTILATNRVSETTFTIERVR